MMKILTLISSFIFLSLTNGLYAEGEAAPAAGGGNFLIGMLLMFAVVFFLIILPQNRKAKKHQELLNSLEKGDDVLTQSGIYGKVYGLTDRVVTLEIAPNTRIRIDRSAIANKVTDAAGKAA